MQRHLRVAVTDWVYWGVCAIASDQGRTQGDVLHDLVEEALRARSLSAGPPAKPATELDETIASAAGLEGIHFDDMKMKLISLGWWTYVEDLAEHAHEVAA